MKNTHERKNHRLLMPALASLAVAMILGWGVAAQAQAVHGTGTTNDIPVWTSTTTIGNSLMKQSGGNVNVSGGLVATTLNSNGDLTLGGSINSSLTLQGNLSDANGQSANVIGGFGGNNNVPGNSVASGFVGATIAGGGGFESGLNLSVPNSVTADWGTVGGGGGNTAAFFSTVAGGQLNNASSSFTTVGGGVSNTASQDSATVGGGKGNTASGENATVPGGRQNSALGPNSFAAGTGAIANNDGSFVWSDDSGSAFPVQDSGPNQFVAQATGGFTFYTAAGGGAGATLAKGDGSWSSLSDRNAKANFSPVDGQALLARLAALPVSTWNYKTQPDSIRHMGPTAQDFRAAFGLGGDEKHISTVDAQGVALAAIQALYEEVTELRARLAHLEQRQ